MNTEAIYLVVFCFSSVVELTLISCLVVLNYVLCVATFFSFVGFYGIRMVRGLNMIVLYRVQKKAKKKKKTKGCMVGILGHFIRSTFNNLLRGTGSSFNRSKLFMWIKIILHLWNPKIHHPLHKIPRMYPIMSHFSPVHTYIQLTRYRFTCKMNHASLSFWTTVTLYN